MLLWYSCKIFLFFTKKHIFFKISLKQIPLLIHGRNLYTLISGNIYGLVLEKLKKVSFKKSS